MVESKIYRLAGGEVVVWAEPGGPIMIKTAEPYGDPVELNEHEASELVSVLTKLIAKTS